MPIVPQVTMSESALYRVESEGRKGFGCIAVNDIKTGTLVFRESPQLLIPALPNIKSYQEIQQHGEIKAFTRMPRKDQEGYRMLYNLYEENI